jgi:phosphoenolpyruvate synthase/pyruvate phosphate dikinase
MSFEVHPFGVKGKATGEASAELLGGKGAGLASMAASGFPVPPGFTLDTTTWAAYHKAPKGTMKEIAKRLPKYLKMLEDTIGYMPLVSVRSGARTSMPGMMNTILNVGIDADTEDFWKGQLGEKCFENTLHRLVIMYGDVVKGLPRLALEQGTSEDALAYYAQKTGEAFPTAVEQILGAIEGVFKSWDTERAVAYRKQNHIPDEWGTAVNIQAMVFGNLNDESATGVLFTRSPDTGEAVVTGEFLVNAQGEDVVAGIRTPQPLVEMGAWNPEVQQELMDHVLKLEKLKQDMQDVEFTIQSSKLFILQTRNSKRTPRAAVKAAVEMVKEGLITPEVAVKRVTPKQFDLAHVPTIDPEFKTAPPYTGIGACSGISAGKPVFSAEAAINCHEPCILITDETTPDDYAGMLASQGILTMKGGYTCHAAVVARGENRTCVVGLGATVEQFKHANLVTLDGNTGNVWLEKVPTVGGNADDMLDAYARMTLQVAGVTPVIYDEPKGLMDEAMLVLGAKMLSPEAAASLVVKTTAKVKHLYVDLTVGAGMEQEYFSLFVPKVWFDQQTVTCLEGAEFKDSSHKGRITLVGPVTSKVFKQLSSANELRDLVLSEGELVAGGSLDLTDPAVKKILDWKAQDGLSFVTVGGIVPGTKSMVPFEMALQTMAGA